jgi:hypothetical protein
MRSPPNWYLVLAREREPSESSFIPIARSSPSTQLVPSLPLLPSAPKARRPVKWCRRRLTRKLQQSGKVRIRARRIRQRVWRARREVLRLTLTGGRKVRLLLLGVGRRSELIRERRWLELLGVGRGGLVGRWLGVWEGERLLLRDRKLIWGRGLRLGRLRSSLLIGEHGREASVCRRVDASSVAKYRGVLPRGGLRRWRWRLLLLLVRRARRGVGRLLMLLLLVGGLRVSVHEGMTAGGRLSLRHAGRVRSTGPFFGSSTALTLAGEEKRPHK